MPGLAERVRGRVDDVRRRRPLIDHLVRMQEHYSAVKAGQQAGAVTYFGFLSFFPILSLAFFVVGWVSRVYSHARDSLTAVLDAIMPGLIGTEAGQIRIDQIERAAATLGIVGALVLLYSGLGWLSAMRDALQVVFETPAREQPGFVLGKLRDLVTLVVIGTVLFVAVAVAGLVGGFSRDLLSWLDLDIGSGWLLGLSIVVGFLAGVLLFFVMFVLLAHPHAPRRSLWAGAALGAVAFELLKQASGLLFRTTQGSPAFQAFGIALILLVWINYFSRVVLYAASFAHTSPAARALRPVPADATVHGPPSPPVRGDVEHPWAAPYAAGALSTLATVALLKRLTRRD